jgi:hypothetical protein
MSTVPSICQQCHQYVKRDRLLWVVPEDGEAVLFRTITYTYIYRVNDKCGAKPAEGESTTQYKEKV